MKKLLSVIPLFIGLMSSGTIIGAPVESVPPVKSEVSVQKNEVTYEIRWSDYLGKYVVDFKNNTAYDVTISYYWTDGEEWFFYKIKKMEAGKVNENNPGGISGQLKDVTWDYINEE